MDASIRNREATAAAKGRGSRAGSDATAATTAPERSGLRVALVHDWLTGMRGGEKCLEVLCRAFPQATLYTLLHRPGSTSPAIESMAIRTSPLQQVPGVFSHYRHLLPLMPLAARTWKPRNIDLVVSLSHCVAKAVRAPRGVPHVCYCFTPMRYAWQGRDSYLESWANRPICRATCRQSARPPQGVGPCDCKAGDPLRCHLADDPRADRDLLRAGEPRDSATRRYRVLLPRRGFRAP